MPYNPPTISGVVLLTSGTTSSIFLENEFPQDVATPVPSSVGYNYLSLSTFSIPGMDYLPTTTTGLPALSDEIRGIWQLVGTPESIGYDYVTYPTVSGLVSEDLVYPDDYSITSTPVTTSGVTLLNFYPGAFVTVWITPVVIDARLFPIFAGIFPQQDRRIYPVLPQYSTIIP